MKSLFVLMILFCSVEAFPVWGQSSDDDGSRIGVYYGINSLSAKGGDPGVTVQGKQGSDLGLMLWYPLIPGNLSLRSALSYKNAVTSYTDSNLNPTSQFKVTESTYDATLGLQLGMYWGFYLFAEGKYSLPTKSSTTVVTPGGNVDLDPGSDLLQAYGLGFELVDTWGLHLSLEAEYDKGSSSRPLGEVNSFIAAQVFANVAF